LPEIVARKMELADDRKHDHVLLVGYSSKHLGAEEPITIDVNRVVANTAIGERFFVKTPDGEADIVAGKCPVCGFEPYPRTSADSGDEQKLLMVPERAG
jgi:hypothetical protein